MPTLRDTLSSLDPHAPDEALLHSANHATADFHRAIERYSPEERRRIDRFARPIDSPDTALLRKAELLERYYHPYRKDALYAMRTMPVGHMVIVDAEHTNNMRVATHYQSKKHGRKYRTDTMHMGARDYLRVVRVE